MFTDILSQRFVRTTSLTVHARHSPMSHYVIDHFIVFWMEYEVDCFSTDVHSEDNS